MTSVPIDILSVTCAQFIEKAAKAGISKPVAIETYRRSFRRGDAGVDWATLPATERGRIQQEDDTTKFTLRLHDNAEVESVIMPQASRTGRIRNTLCISCQVGCARGCTFCQTAQMRLMRNLTAAEIVAQWHAARFSLGMPISNIVFMGMGEPMDNLDAVIRAIRILADHNGPSVSSSAISVSTCGVVQGISRLAALANEPGFKRLGLAVSVNAPNDAIRSQLMPVNRSAPMADVMDALLRWPIRKAGRILIEYVLIPGVNDAMEHADQLCEYLRPLACMVNVIPLNPPDDSPWPAPDHLTVRNFIDRVIANGVFVKQRRTIGRTISGACGQLGQAGTA